ncbi:hypothetical protein ACTD5D_21085 [Nocardia takedensis]|uniref:hypothetical protein n=1 Tax=Nocardia takedensis TaxID=259390 RepID=UPI003F771D1A
MTQAHIALPISTPIGHVRDALDSAHAEYVVVLEESKPIATLGRADLDQVADAAKSVGLLAAQVSLLAMMDAMPDKLDVEELIELAVFLAEHGLSQVLLVSGPSPVGVVPRAAAAAAMPKDLRQFEARTGNPAVAAIGYRCDLCNPAQLLLLRTPPPDGAPPICRRVYFHGPMAPI